MLRGIEASCILAVMDYVLYVYCKYVMLCDPLATVKKYKGTNVAMLELKSGVDETTIDYMERVSQ